MDGEAFEVWLSAVAVLTDQQRDEVLRALALAEARRNEPVAADTGIVLCETSHSAELAPPRPRLPEAEPVTAAAERRVEATGCPHCGGRRLQRWGHSHGLPRYRCNGCRRSFNGLTGTPLARLRKKDRWAAQAEAMLAGESLAKAAKRCGVAASTAFRWRHRFLQAPALDKPGKLVGIVEADETFILESFKGKRSGLPRPARKRGGKAAKRGLSREQIPILVARDRTGHTTDAVLPRLSRAAITAALDGVVTTDNQLCCDGGKAIVGFARRQAIACSILPKPGGPRPEAPNLHINNVNAYHGRLKEWLRPFHGVATKYLNRYLGWRRSLEALGDGRDQQRWLGAAMGMPVCQQLTR